MRLQLIVWAAATAATGQATAAADDSGWRLATDALIYADTDNVVVVSPQVGVHRSLDDGGGEVSASAVVDAITAASVDVVSQATSGFDEVRTEGNLGLSKALGLWLPQASYRFSHEPDYDSHRVRLGLQRSLAGRDTTLAAGYAASFDDVGMTGAAPAQFSESLQVHAIDLSVAQVLGKRTVARLAYTLTLQDGYMEKPYRLVPLFEPSSLAAAAAEGVTIDLDSFDRYRLAFRPREQVPDRRIGHAIAGRLLRRVAAVRGSIRIDYQLYVDDWGLVAHTVEPGLHAQLTDRLTAIAYTRLYRQSGVDFWQRTYTVSGPQMLPVWRTLDRDLSPFESATGAARIELGFGPITGYVETGAMLTHYDDYLFLTSRLALVGQLGVRWSP